MLVSALYIVGEMKNLKDFGLNRQVYWIQTTRLEYSRFRSIDMAILLASCKVILVLFYMEYQLFNGYFF